MGSSPLISSSSGRRQSLARPLDLDGAVLEVVFPTANKVRARRVVSRSNCRTTGKHPSWKVGRMVHWESGAERNAFLLLDASPCVRAYCEQPARIRYELRGRSYAHTPDILVESDAGREMWEVKSASDAADPHVRARTRLLEHLLPDHGFAYRLVLAEELAREPRLSNVRLILRHGRARIDEREREEIRQLATALPQICWGAVMNGTLGPRGLAVVCRLILEGFLRVDFDQPISRETRIYPSHRA